MHSFPHTTHMAHIKISSPPPGSSVRPALSCAILPPSLTGALPHPANPFLHCRPLTLVLARVCLGRCQVVRDGRGRRNAPFLPQVEGRSTTVLPVYYDSIVTEVPGMRCREIVVGRDMAVYPELLVEYERV